MREFDPETINPLDHMCAYIHYTLCANWYYSRLPDNYALSTDKNVERAYARARYFDRIAVEHRAMLNDAQWRICSEFYSRAYKQGRTPLDYHLPLAFDSSPRAVQEAYPSQTYEVMIDYTDVYHPDFGWL